MSDRSQHGGTHAFFTREARGERGRLNLAATDSGVDKHAASAPDLLLVGTATREMGGGFVSGLSSEEVEEEEQRRQMAEYMMMTQLQREKEQEDGGVGGLSVGGVGNGGGGSGGGKGAAVSVVRRKKTEPLRTPEVFAHLQVHAARKEKRPPKPKPGMPTPCLCVFLTVCDLCS